MNMPTDQQLKLALARELPELVSLYSPDGEAWWLNNGSKTYKVTNREWDWIVRECEKKLRINPGTWQPGGIGHYITTLAILVGDCKSGETSLNECLNTVTANWQQRAIAYFKTMGKKIV